LLFCFYRSRVDSWFRSGDLLDHLGCESRARRRSVPIPQLWDRCGEHAQCSNIPGSFNCTCDLGYSGNGTICTQISEKDESNQAIGIGVGVSFGLLALILLVLLILFFLRKNVIHLFFLFFSFFFFQFNY